MRTTGVGCPAVRARIAPTERGPQLKCIAVRRPFPSRMKPKPSGLEPEYGAQFRDESVARAYAHRAPYPSEVFEFLGSLQPDGPGWVLELGCGSGDLTGGLAPHTRSLDAVDPSEAMVAVGRQRYDDPFSRITWHAVSAEAFHYTGPYSLVVAAGSLHWMDWEVVLPHIASSTAPQGHLAIVDRSRQLPEQLDRGLRALIPLYSTNQDYEPYDLVYELEDRGLFQTAGRREFVGHQLRQSASDFVESIHSQNGFSRDRMSKESADEFDRRVGELVCPHLRRGVLHIPTGASVVWGRAKDA